MARLRDIGTGAVAPDDFAKQIASMQKQLNDWGRLLSNEDRTKIINDDTGTPRILIGVNPEGGIGLYVSKPGESVLEAFS